MTHRSGRRTAVLACLAAASLLLTASVAAAHERSYSYSSWRIDGAEAVVSVRLASRDLARLPLGTERAPEDALAGYLVGHLEMYAAAGRCLPVAGPQRLARSGGMESFEWRLRCRGSDLRAIRSGLFFDILPRHLNFARVVLEGGASLERVLSRDRARWELAGPGATLEAPSVSSAVAGYLGLGAEHILGGYDHLAFLLALLLIGTSLGQVAAVVTGFTVGHSVTLALAVTGLVRTQPASVEAIIGLSIALVAAENLWHTGGRPPRLGAGLAALVASLALVAWAGLGRVPALTFAGLALFIGCYFALLERVAQPRSLRWWLALIFGLVHGFGFAGALMETGLPPGRLGWALAGFNLGVELGQLALVALVWPLLWLAARRPSFSRGLIEAGSAAVLALGVFWFCVRNY